MKLFYWNKNFETGIESIDCQHKILVDILNQVSNAIATCQDTPKINLLLNELVLYTQVHFSDEEAIMFASNMPIEEQISHKNQHRKFIQQLSDIKILPDDIDEKVTEDLLDFLTTWLVSHILASDMDVARYSQKSKLDISAIDQEFGLDVSKIELTLLRALNESERRFRFLTDHTPAIIWASDVKGKRIFFNKSWYNFIGDNNDNWFDYIHPQDRLAYSNFIDEHLNSRTEGSIEVQLKNEQGHYHYFLEKIIPRIDDNNIFYGFISSAIDITQLKNAESALKQSKIELEAEVERRTTKINELMVTDSLTGVGNRRYFDDLYNNLCSAAQRHETPLTLLYFDLDNFKFVNDNYGHDIGDNVLIAFASLLKDIFRDCDVIARFGGEEFVGVLQNTDEQGAMVIGERILAECQKLTFPDIEYKLTVSLGIAQRRKNETKQDLLKRADRAMYQSKNQGRNRLTLAEPIS